MEHKLKSSDIETLDQFKGYLSTRFVVSIIEDWGWREWLWLPPFSEYEFEDFWVNLSEISILSQINIVLPGEFFDGDQYPKLLRKNHSEKEIWCFLDDHYQEGLRTKPYVASPSGYDAAVYEAGQLKYKSKGHREKEDVPAYESRIILGDSPIAICSGGQTGVDRGALDAAMKKGYKTLGWCPKGRLADDGVIPAKYALEELTDGGYRQRTLKNVVESDGTLIIYWGYPSSGTQETLKICINKHKPYKLIDAAVISERLAEREVYKFITDFGIGWLNVAGPKESSQQGEALYAEAVIRGVIELLDSSGELVPKPCEFNGDI